MGKKVKKNYHLKILTKKQTERESPRHFPHDKLTDISPLICCKLSERTTPHSVKLEFIIRGLWEIEGSDWIALIQLSMKHRSHVFGQLWKNICVLCVKFCSCFCVSNNTNTHKDVNVDEGGMTHQLLDRQLSSGNQSHSFLCDLSYICQ